MVKSYAAGAGCMTGIYQGQLTSCPHTGKPPAKGIDPFAGGFLVRLFRISMVFALYCLCNRDIMLWVNLLVVFPDFEVYMRPGSVAGVPGKGNPFPPFYDIVY